VPEKADSRSIRHCWKKRETRTFEDQNAVFAANRNCKKWKN